MGRFDEFVTGIPDPTYTEPEPTAPQIPLPRPRPGAEYFAPPEPPQPGSSRFDEFVSGAPTVAPVAPGGVDWSRYNQPMGTLKPWETSPSEDITHAVQDQLIGAGANPFRAKQLADISVTAARVHPLINAGVSAADLPYHLARGEKVAAALDALGIAPAGLAARRMYQGASPLLPLDARPTLPIADTPLGATPPRSGWSPVDANQVSLMEPRPDLFPSLPRYNLGTPRPPGAPLQDELRAAGDAAYRRAAANPTQWDPRAMNHYIDTSVKYLQQAGPHGTPHIEQNSPDFYNLMEKWWQQNAGRSKPVTSTEWDALRQQLYALPGGPGNQSDLAGSKAAHLLDNYILNPAGTVSGTVQDLDRLRRDLFVGRGNWRDYKTASALEKDLTQRTSSAISKGQPTGPAATNTLDYFANTDPGINSTYAKPEQRAAIRAAAESNPTVARWLAGGLSSPTAASIGTSVGGGLGYMLGGPVVAGAGAVIGAGAPKVASIPFGSIANVRERQAAEELISQIRRGSPLYAERSNPNIANPTALPTVYGQTPYRPPVGQAPIADPRSQLRDAIAYALTPQVQREGKRQLDLSFVPYENRDVSPPLSEEQP